MDDKGGIMDEMGKVVSRVVVAGAAPRMVVGIKVPGNNDVLLMPLLRGYK